MTFKRWKVTVRTNRGSYGVHRFYRKARADGFARDYEDRGLGQATVSRA